VCCCVWQCVAAAGGALCWKVSRVMQCVAVCGSVLQLQVERYKVWCAQKERACVNTILIQVHLFCVCTYISFYMWRLQVFHAVERLFQRSAVCCSTLPVCCSVL